MDNPTPNQQPNTGMGGAPAQPTNPAPAAPTGGMNPGTGMGAGQPGMSNLQNSPLFTDPGPTKKSNSAIIILVIVLVLAIAAGVVFMVLSRSNQNANTPADDAILDQSDNGAFGSQETSNRDLNSTADVTSEISDINADIEALNIESFDEQLSEIDDILNDINI